MKRRLYLITKSYPYLGGESSFLEPEVPYLKKGFELLYIVTEKSDEKSNLIDNAIVINNDMNVCQKVINLVRFLLYQDAWIEIRNILRSKHCIVKQLYRGLMFGTFAVHFYHELCKKLKLSRDTDALFYFYWWDYKCLGLTMNKGKYPHIQIVARTHGYDLYDERELFGRQFFKEQMDRELDRLIFASEYGKAYYLNKNKKKDSRKYPVHRLGLNPHICEERSINRMNGFTLLSCSNVVDIKRIDLIIEGLSLVEEPIKWVHIGDGPCKLQLEEKANKLLQKKANISYTWLGSMPNKQVMEFYQTEQVHGFITTTATEGGNPVSIQEALSYGVPIIGTKISDIPFMIEGNGILLSENPDPEEVADAITKMCQADERTYNAWHQNALQKFQSFYNADIVHSEMLQDILSLKLESR